MDTKKIIVLIALAGVAVIYMRKAAAQTGGGTVLESFFSPITGVFGGYRSYDIMSYRYVPGALPVYDAGLSPLDNLNIAAAYQQNSSVENERQHGSAASKAALGAASNYYLAVANKVGESVEASLDSRMYPPGGSPAWRRNYSNQVLSLYRAEAAPSGGLGGLGSLITFSNAKTVATILA